MPSQIRSPAYLYCVHYLKIGPGQWGFISVTLSELPENIGYFPPLCRLRSEGLRGQRHGAYFSDNLLTVGVSMRSSGLFVAATFLLVRARKAICVFF